MKNNKNEIKIGELIIQSYKVFDIIRFLKDLGLFEDIKAIIKKQQEIAKKKEEAYGQLNAMLKINGLENNEENVAKMLKEDPTLDKKLAEIQKEGFNESDMLSDMMDYVINLLTSKEGEKAIYSLLAKLYETDVETIKNEDASKLFERIAEVVSAISKNLQVFSVFFK